MLAAGEGQCQGQAGRGALESAQSAGRQRQHASADGQAARRQATPWHQGQQTYQQRYDINAHVRINAYVLCLEIGESLIVLIGFGRTCSYVDLLCTYSKFAS